MSPTDLILPFLAFCVAFSPLLFKKGKFGKEEWTNVVLAVFIFGFSIWISSNNTDDIKEAKHASDLLQEDVTALREERKVDSINDAIFQKYLKDSFGIERKGDTAVKISYFTNNFYSSGQQGNKELSDSINFYFKLEKDILFIAPKEGSWVRPFFATDTSNNGKNQNIVEEGMGPMPQTDNIVINNKNYTIGTYLIYERAVYLSKPIELFLSGNINQFIIFGEQGSLTKRYLYKNGKVSWFPYK